VIKIGSFSSVRGLELERHEHLIIFVSRLLAEVSFGSLVWQLHALSALVALAPKEPY
jgi:hypothetical protein